LKIPITGLETIEGRTASDQHESARVCGRFGLPVVLAGLFFLLAAAGLVIPPGLRLSRLLPGLTVLPRLLVFAGLVALPRLTLPLALLLVVL
jgi:hypothetical protein